jgi:HK97 family phage prohead protease
MNTLADRATAHSGLIHRSFVLDTIEFRDGDEGTGFHFEGVASVVDTPYTVRDQWGEFTETIRAGAFDKTLAEVERRSKKNPAEDVALYVNHRHLDVPMASTAGNTLRLTADPHLRVDADLDPERSDVVIARSALRRQELREMSIGFNVPKPRDEWNDDMTVRTIHEVKLNEVSIVRRGANPHTSASIRSLDELIYMFPEGADVDPDELRRAISYLERLLPVDEPEARDADPERLQALLKMWDHLRTPAA